MTDRTTNRARAVTWAAFILGVAASIAANVAHAQPDWGPRLAGAFAPVALLAVIEMLARVPWPAGGRWRAGKWLGAAVVAGVAAVTSYRHMAGLLVAYGEDELTASILPLAVDGLMVVASAALLAMGRGRTVGAPAPATDGASVDAVDAPELLVTAPPEAPAPVPVSAPDPAPPAPPLAPAAVPLARQPERQRTRQPKRQAPARAASEVAEEARQMYAASLDTGDPLTGRQLAEMYDRSPAWGRERIAEAKRASVSASAPG